MLLVSRKEEARKSRYICQYKCYHILVLNTGLQFIVTEGDIKVARLPRTQEFSNQ